MQIPTYEDVTEQLFAHLDQVDPGGEWAATDDPTYDLAVDAFLRRRGWTRATWEETMAARMKAASMARWAEEN